MAAYLVGQITVKDDKLWQEYVSGVAESIAPFDATIIFRGKRDKVLAGSHDYKLIVVIEFSDLETIDNWFNSPKYQSLIPVRDQAVDVVITTYQVL